MNHCLLVIVSGFNYNFSGKDSCDGDSGGPLAYRDSYNNGPWYQAGIVSYMTKFDCGDGQPSFYNKIGGYLDWIESKLEV